MKYRYWLAALVALSLIGSSSGVEARGGGARGGGGRAGGGGGGGGVSRPTPSAAARPSINSSAFGGMSASRPAAAAAARPATPAPRTSAGQLGGMNSGAGNLASGASRPAARSTGAAASRATAGTPASRSQLNNFLGLPEGSGASTHSNSSSGGGSRSHTTDNGTTITVGGGSRSGSTAGGATVGGAAGGIKVETAGGETYVRGRGAVGATDGVNSAVAGGSVRAAQNSAGDSVAQVRRSYADSSGYRATGTVTAAQGRNGYTAVNARGAAGTAGNIRVGSTTAIRTPYGATVATGRGAAFVNGQFVGGTAWNAVNGNYTHWGYYGPAWGARYPNYWYPGRWAVVGVTAYAATSWLTAGAYCGCSGDPVYYDYDNSIVYNVDGNVYVDGQPVASAEEYYEQASAIAATGSATTDDEWMPLGVFAVLTDEQQTQTDKTVQLAVNQQGVIRGNLHDELTDTLVAIEGAVNKQTQRVAMTLVGVDGVVVETGLYNLTNDEVPILLHRSANESTTCLLVRLTPEQEAGATESGSAAPGQ